MAKSKSDATFEQDLEALEAIVGALEEGGLSLDDALKQFESGITLARRCEKALSEAEKKIEILVKNADGDQEPQPFDEEAPPAPVSAPAPAKVPAAAAPAATRAPATPAKPVAPPQESYEPEPTPEPDEEDLLF
ncbi:MAG: exodeoxyribonuclease VII small subunit [Candidatus Hydrogenedentes bacterium]|nr:exodeoxyribonuclease VII small subunit [Candidatus Hydrogenedentota bacterium]